MTVEELRIILSVTGASQAGHAIHNVANNTNQFNSALGNLYGTLARLLSVGLIGKFAKECVNAASDLQEVANVMDVTFGEKSSEIDLWAKTQAASFGMSETAAKRYLGNLGTMAKQFGYTTDQAAAMAVQITKLTGDVSSFYNLDNATAYNKLKSIFTGETESLKELGVVMTEAQLNAYAMQKGIGKQVKEMSEGEKVMLRYSFVTEKLSHVNGDFARTSDGWANSTRTIGLELENLKIQIGNELLPVASYGLSLITNGLRLISPFLISIAETVKKYTIAWQNANSVTKTYVKTALGIIAVMIIAPKIISIVSAAVRLLTIQITTLGGALMAVGGIISVVLLGLAFSNLTKQIKASADDIGDMSEIADSTSGYVDSLADSLDGLSDSAKDLDVFLASFDEVNKVGGNSSLMSSLVNSDDITNILSATAGLEDLQKMLGDIESAVKNTDLSLSTKGTFLDAKWWEGLGLGAIDFVAEFFDGSWKDDWMIGAEMITDFMEEKFPEFTKKLEDWGGDVYDTVQKIKNGILELLGIKEKPTLEDEIIEADLANKPISETVKFFQQKAHALDYNTLTTKGLKNNVALATGGVLNADHIIAEPYNVSVNELRTKTEAKTEANRNEALNARNEDINRLLTTTQLILDGINGINQKDFAPTIQLDGDKITRNVVHGINTITKSLGMSPLIDMG